MNLDILEPSDSSRGKLFPLWVVKTFKDFVLAKETVKKGEDPCREIPKMKATLRPYQAFLSKYLAHRMPFQGLLVYHGLGSGKTAGAIHLMAMLNSNKIEYNVFLLVPAALKESWRSEMRRWLPDPSVLEDKIHLISTNASNLEEQFFSAIKKADSSRKNVFMVDEAHNFISNVYSNYLSGNRKRRAAVVYEYMQNEILSSPETKVVLLSGTPIRANPFESALLFNLLRPGSFPGTEAAFNALFLSWDEDIPRLRPGKKHLFQRRILGLTSYFRGSSPALYAQRRVHYMNLDMDPRQEDVYSYYEAIEKKAEATALSKGRRSTQSFKTSTRLTSNFSSPVKPTKRPRPADFRLGSRDEELLLKGENVKDDLAGSVKQYLRACNDFISGAERYFTGIKSDLSSDFEAWRSGKWESFDDFRRAGGKTKLFEELVGCSVKMTAALFLVISSPGPVVVYSNFVVMEGLQAFAMYLRIAGIKDYVEYHGSIPHDVRQDNLKRFNEGKARVILLSSAGSEGISLKNVRTVVVLEPAWSEDVIQQVIGRAIRQCSHRELPMEDRIVDIYRLKAVRSGGNALTTDEYVQEQALRRHSLKQSFLEAIKEAAVDCDLFTAQNNLEGTCFRFPVDQMLKDQPGPAYLKSVEDEAEKEDAYEVARLKVRKIRAEFEGEEGEYLLDEQSGVVFTVGPFHLPVGAVLKDAKGFFQKSSAETYVISKKLII